ncbi:MAG: DUF222 domain-containing protein [Acidimicrobiia bacterium]
MGVINAATAQLVSVIRDVLETDAWCGAGLRSPAQWVAWRAGVSPTRAAALVQMARRVEELPTVAAAFAEGRLSEDSVKLVATRVPAERDAEVAELAQVMTVPQLTRVLRSLPQQQPEQSVVEAEAQVAFGHDDDGSWSLRASGLAAERGALVAKALHAARDAVFRERPSRVSWADALERMALAALEALDPASGGGRAASERYQVVVHVGAGEDPASHLHLGPALSASARRRITCDATLRWVLEHQGRTVAWGRKRRTVPTPLRVAIEDRDRGCRVPGCTQARWLEVHHLKHVEDGGETVPENLLCLCGRHHDDHHQGRLGITGDPTRPDGLVFTDPWGREVDRPRSKRPDDPIPVTGSWTAPSGESFDGRWFAWN